nr:MAG TPA: hypothetical protein [Caudoviricetes sp.]
MSRVLNRWAMNTITIWAEEQEATYREVDRLKARIESTDNDTLLAVYKAKLKGVESSIIELEELTEKVGLNFIEKENPFAIAFERLAKKREREQKNG